MPTSDDQQALQIECARADARSMHGAYGPRFELRKLVRALNEERRRLLEQVK